jgi:tetratricopeptide (TPR) repeat protein
MDDANTPHEHFARAVSLRSAGRAREADEAFVDFYRRFATSADAAVRLKLAEALLNVGVSLVRAGETSAAVAVLDKLVGEHAEADESVAAALYNKGIALRDAGRLPEAAATFTEAVERFAESASPVSRRFAAMAIYNRAITQARLGDSQGSVASAEEMLRRFRASGDDPVVRLRLAKALYNRALLMWLAGKKLEAIEAFGHVANSFMHDRGAEVEALVVAARRRAVFMALGEMSSEELRANATSNDFIQSGLLELEAAIRNAPPERVEGHHRELAKHREFLDTQCAANEAMHRQAASILTQYLHAGEPFALFLRNFDLEATFHLGELGSRPMWTIGQVAFRNPVEEQLAEAMQGRVPILGILNNVPMMIAYTHHIPRLQLPNENWQVVVEELARAAELVVVNVSRLAPGVLAELDMLRRLEKETRSIVIISEGSGTTPLLHSLTDGPALAPQAQQGCAELDGFPWVFHEQSFAGQQAKDWLLFDVLLQQIEQKRRLPPEQRMRWDGVNF